MDGTRIDVVDGCDGLTPDMLRRREVPWWQVEHIKSGKTLSYMQRERKPFFSDPMHD